MLLQGVSYSDEHFWSTLATITYIGDDIETNPVVLTRGKKVDITSRWVDRFTNGPHGILTFCRRRGLCRKCTRIIPTAAASAGAHVTTVADRA